MNEAKSTIINALVVGLAYGVALSLCVVGRFDIAIIPIVGSVLSLSRVIRFLIASDIP